ncbi:hypothetical protein ACHAQA_000459 [Verticillium albo-atrum]
MPSFKSTFLAVAAAFIATATAEDYWIDPESIAKPVRLSWCRDQRSSCPSICSQTSEGDPLVNDCDADALNYGCICSDGEKPNMTEYSLTLPYHVCTAWGQTCIADCGSGNNACASSCREDHPCGATDPQRVNATESSASPTADATASQTSDGATIFTGLAGNDDDNSDSDSSDSSSSDSSSSSNNDNSAASTLSRGMGLTVLVGGLVGAFAILL